MHHIPKNMMQSSDTVRCDKIELVGSKSNRFEFSFKFDSFTVTEKECFNNDNKNWNNFILTSNWLSFNAYYSMKI